MHKIVLSFTISLSALSLNAQIPGISATAAYDDFNSVSDYKTQTNDKAWDEVQNAPSQTSFAYRGIFWPNTNNYSRTRNGDGKITYKVTQAQAEWSALAISFGSYSNTTANKTPYTIDLSNNANLSFTIKNAGDIRFLRVYVEVYDVKDTALTYMSGARQSDFYTWFLGFVEGNSIPLENNTLKNYSIDLKTAVVGEGEFNSTVSTLGNSKFDYSKVKNVKIIIVQHENTGFDGNYQPLALVDYPVEISNFRLGDVSSVITNIEKEETESEGSEVVSVYDSMGQFVATGKMNSLGLEYGKLYIIKSGNKSRKIVMN